MEIYQQLKNFKIRLSRRNLLFEATTEESIKPGNGALLCTYSIKNITWEKRNMIENMFSETFPKEIQPELISISRTKETGDFYTLTIICRLKQNN